MHIGPTVTHYVLIIFAITTGFLLRMALAGTMAFIAGTTCPDRITVRHIAMVLTVINVIDTRLRYIWAVLRYICSCWRFVLQMYTKLAYYVSEHCGII